MSVLLLTDAGKAKIEAAYQAGEVVRLSTAVVGDGNDASVVPNPSMTALVHEFGRVPLTDGSESEGIFSGAFIIESTKFPGKVLREYGLIDEDGVLIFISSYPETLIPAQAENVIKEIIVNFSVAISGEADIEIVIDPSISLITQEQANSRYLQIDNNLSEIAEGGDEAQQTSREHLGLKSGGIHDVTDSPEDVTPERLLKTGDYGLGLAIPIPEGTDLSVFLATAKGAFYHCDSSVGYTFAPDFDGWFDIHVTIHEDKDYRTLFAVDAKGHIATASIGPDELSGSPVINGWTKVYSTLDKPTPKEIFPLAEEIGDDADLNSFTAPGLYCKTGDAMTSTGGNYPEPLSGSLEVYKHAGITQIYRIYNNSRSYIRTLYNGQWSGWAKQYDAANPPPQPDLSPYETVTDANARFIQGVMLSAQQATGDTYNTPGDHIIPAGGVLTGLNGKRNGDNIDIRNMYYKYVQENANGTIITIPG